MKNITYTEDFAAKFKQVYAYKMGGSQTIVFPNGQRFDFNDKEYYSGRGNKYNSSVKHDNIGEVFVSKEALKSVLNAEKERQILIKNRIKTAKEKQKRILKSKKEGIYSIKVEQYGNFIELSETEVQQKCFDAQMLANTLKISVNDAFLLNSTGKTYVYAKSEDGKAYELYHPSLSCNDLSISFCEVSEDKIKNMNHTEWLNAPYAHLLGQTNNINHFVC